MTSDAGMSSDWARFWAVDLHVHTPGSLDAKVEQYGTADDIVRAAIDAGLHAIAVTDHNTSAWCKQVAEAASGKGLIVLPGVEISTTEGHLLAIWEEGTDPVVVDELLVRLGIGRSARGKLDIAADFGFADTAREVDAAGGVAIAAHVEKPKGLLKLGVKAHLKKTLLCEEISAVEVVHLDTRSEVNTKIGGARKMAFVRGSDTWDVSLSCHALSGIGLRRTWIKASRPDLIGIRHALADPDLRVSLEAPNEAAYSRIESVEMIGGFLGGERIDLAPDLNCLLGGTGTGKSLILEAVRFGLQQQVDPTAFSAIRDEIDSRMNKALMNGSVVRLTLLSGGKRYKVERTFSPVGSDESKVFQQTADDWAEVDLDPAQLCPLAAFSQGEILDYSREPVGRVTLVDAALDLVDIDRRIDEAVCSLHTNARKLIKARERVGGLAEEAGRASDLKEQVRKLSDVFKTDAVKAQSGWTAEQALLQRTRKRIGDLEVPSMEVPDAVISHSVAENEKYFSQASNVVKKLKSLVDQALETLGSAITEAESEIMHISSAWDNGFIDFKSKLDEELEKVDAGSSSSLTALRASLEQLQGRLARAKEAELELNSVAKPDLLSLQSEREDLVNDLHEARKERRSLRRARVSELNAKAAGLVKLDVPNEGDSKAFRDALTGIKVGSRVKEEFLNQLALRTHPLKFSRSLWAGDTAAIVDAANGIDATSVAKLLANIDDQGLWEELLEMQTIDRPDVLTIRFKKPDDNQYTAIEELSHGQRCTAILVILLADGDTPVLVDQPEDALHAPWIEAYLVDRLRDLRGSRQYIFATRSPGIVVSGDAEQIVTMKATAGHGEVEASGSLERHKLNRLALDHLEGGPVPFSRRAMKLRLSVGN